MGKGKVESAARASAGALEEQRGCIYTRVSLTTKGYRSWYNSGWKRAWEVSVLTLCSTQGSYESDQVAQGYGVLTTSKDRDSTVSLGKLSVLMREKFLLVSIQHHCSLISCLVCLVLLLCTAAKSSDPMKSPVPSVPWSIFQMRSSAG